jgi:hypothetical protein
MASTKESVAMKNITIETVYLTVAEKRSKEVVRCAGKALQRHL